MNIAIDIRSTLKKKTGIGTYTVGLVNALAKIDRENKYFLYSYIRPFDFKRRLWQLPGSNFHHKVDRLSFSPERAMKDADVLHTSSYDMPASRFYSLVTTVHDLVPLVFPQGYSEDYLFKLKDDIKRVLCESKVIIVDSVNTGNDIEKMFPDNRKRVEVVYPGRDEGFKVLDKRDAVSSIKERYGIREGFLLYSGGMDPRKNVLRLMDAFSILKRSYKLSHKLVVVGAKGKWGAELTEKISDLKLDNEVIFPGYVPVGDLNSFYSAADCFVYPSLYEGFGFPILEAFSSGTPVVTSSTSSCGEISSDAAFTVDPTDTEGISEAIYKVITDQELASTLIARGKRRAADFSWDVSAKRILDLFRGN